MYTVTRFFVFCAFFVYVKAQSTSVTTCLNHSNETLPLNTYVHGCVEPPCQLPQLQDVVVDVIFRASRTISNMTTLAEATVHFIIDFTVPYPLGANAITCNFFTNTFCPILAGEVVQYRLRMFIESFFPAGTLATVEFQIVDNDRGGESIWCIRLPIQVIQPVIPPTGAGKTPISELDVN